MAITVNLKLVVEKNPSMLLCCGMCSLRNAWTHIILTVGIVHSAVTTNKHEACHIQRTGGSSHQSVNHEEEEEKRAASIPNHGTPTWITRYLSGESISTSPSGTHGSH